MAIAAGFGFASRPNFSFRFPLRGVVRKVRFSSVEAVDTIDEPESFTKDNSGHDSVYAKGRVDGDGPKKKPAWKRFSSKDIGISNSMIPRPTRMVLNGLKREGTTFSIFSSLDTILEFIQRFEVYLVGGCVRDLVLKRTPKDFDIITSAELKEVMRTFSQCRIIGRRFPICHVHIDDTIVEVSSFSNSAAKSGRDISSSFERHDGFEEKDYILWRNCLQRDFTINGLMFDPYANLVYDYLGGVKDIKNAKVRTVIPANISLLEDCARILRAVRIAARLGFRFTKETAHNVKNLAGSVLSLDKGRLLMEMNYMLAYGSAEASLRLLWKFGLLEILLPIQAAYFVRLGFRRRDTRSNMLLCLFSNMDKLLAPDKPCHSSIWVAILAFHKALSDKPRDPIVVAAFSLAVHNGGDMLEALNIARRISKPHDTSLHELLVPQNLDSEVLKDEVMHLSASVLTALSNMTDEYFVSQAMAEYPKAPYSDLVLIPLGLYLRVRKIFECVKEGKEEQFVAKQGSKVDHGMLTLGSLQEVRHVFARVVFDTLYPINLRQD